MKVTRRLVPALIALLLVGCATEPLPSSDPTDENSSGGVVSEAPQHEEVETLHLDVQETPSDVVTIETVWAQVGCKENDFADSFGTISEAESPVLRTGSCFAFEQDSTSFFYELENETAAYDWFQSGALEVGVNDSLFIEGGIIMLAKDPSASSEFAKLFDAFG